MLRSLADFGAGLFEARKPEPSYPVLPDRDEKGESSIPGVYLVGEVAGTPLIKLGLDAGHEMVAQLVAEVRAEGAAATAEAVYDFVIVGAGAAGLGAASHAQELGLKAVVIEANHVAETVYTMMKGKLLFAEPETVELASSMWFEECTREQLLQKWEEQIAEKGLDVRPLEKVTDIRRAGGLLEVESQKQTYKGRRVILAVGKAGNPRKAGVAGEVENAARISHRLLDPDEYDGRRILIYGGGDVALEAALALAEANDVTLVTIDEEFIYPKKRNVDALLALQQAGKVTIEMNSFLHEVGADSVSYSRGGAGSVPRVVATTGRAALLASVTTAAGFGAAIIAHHAGVQQMGYLALIGIGCTCVASTVLFPSFLRVLERGPAPGLDDAPGPPAPVTAPRLTLLS